MFKNRSYTAISLILFIYTTLIVLTVSLPVLDEKPQLATILKLMFGISCLYGAVLYLLFAVIRSFIKTLETLKKELKEQEQTLTSIYLEHDKALEKRTLEIGVINASLNREVAERMQAEAEAKELQKQMELILNSAGEGIFGLDSEGNLTFANTAALLMIGWEAADLIGKSHHDLVHHSYADGREHVSHHCPIRQAFKDGIVHSSSDDVFWNKDGTCFPVEYVSTPILENENVVGAVVVFRDTSTFA